MDELIRISNLIRKRLRDDWDAVIAVTGTEGVGKTTLAIQLSRKTDDNFSLEKNVIYIPDVQQIVNKITKELEKYAVIVIDEAIKTMYKRRWFNKLQIFLNQIYSICRKENKCSILCMAQFRDFDSFFRQHRIMLWIHVIARGHAVVFIRDWSPFCTDPWHIDENQKIILKKRGRHRIADESLTHKLQSLRKSMNYLTDFKFNKLPKAMEERYKELNKEYRLAMPGIEEGRWTVKYRECIKKMSKHLYKEEGWSQQEIADGFGIARQTINEYCQGS